MKSLYFGLLGIIFLPLIHGAGLGRKDIISITKRRSFGLCIGYCEQWIEIRPPPTKLTARLERYSPANKPPIEKRYPFSSKQWEDLIKLVNPIGFRTLTDKIACPLCRDGGGESIEIKWPNLTKRVTFDFGVTIEGFEQFIEALRTLEKTYLDPLQPSRINPR